MTRVTKLCILGVVLVLAVVAAVVAVNVFADSEPSPPSSDGRVAADAVLRVDGNVIRRADGSRFIVKGANIFGLPHYTSPGSATVDQALLNETEQTYKLRHAIAAQMRSLGLNTIRLQVGSEAYKSELYMSRAEYVQRVYDIVEAFKAEGIYTIVGDHDYTGDTAKFTANYRNSFELFQAIIAKVGAREPYLIFNPFNEPSNDTNWAAWRTPNRETLQWLRGTAGFQGIVLLDTASWSWEFSPAEAQAMIDFDRTLHPDGQPNVVFSNHRYPGDNTSWTGSERTSYIESVLQYADRYPLLSGEHGWSLNGRGWDDSQPDGGAGWQRGQWLSELLDYLSSTAVPAGHNGVVAWVWHWDFNSLTSQDRLTLNQHGEIFFKHYFSKVP